MFFLVNLRITKLMKSRIRRIGINIISLLEFFKKERIYGLGKINIKRIKLLSKGFYSLGQVPFNFQKFSYSDFISDFENIKLSYLNYPYGRLLRDKVVFSLFFKNFCNVPEIYGIINNGNVKSAARVIESDGFEYLIEILTKKKIILKPRFGTGGQGIIKVALAEDGNYFINNKIITKEEFINFISKLNDYIAVEFIQQSTFSEKFFPDSTNTIRITTYCDPKTNDGEILYSLMRFGRKKSAPADNVGTGGIYSLIDLNTGKLKQAIELGENGKYTFHNSHPDTKVNIVNVDIPQWDNLKQSFKNLASLISPYIKFAGWDIILTDNSYYLIEGNNGPDLYIQGPEYPLASNHNEKNFLRSNFIR